MTVTRHLLGRGMTYEDISRRIAWCRRQFGPSYSHNGAWVRGNWFLDGTHSFLFRNRRDAFWFKLAWS
jgi:hypothetical protein